MPAPKKINLPYKPRDLMLPYHDRIQRFACIVAHRRFGKTTATINDLQRGALSCKRENPRFAYISPLLKQSKDVAWDMLKTAARPLFKYGAKANEAELRIDYPNGGRVRLYGADNPDAMRGVYLDGVVLDEYAQMDPGLFPEVIRPALADRDGWATFIGTPKGRDAFWKIWRLALTDPVGWYSLILRASETGVLPKKELEAIYREMGDHNAYMREMECSFDEPAEMQFIPSKIVSDAVSRDGRGLGPRLLGVDIARAGSDSNVILFRNGDVVLQDDIIRFKQADLMQTVGRVTEIINDKNPDAVFIDGAGVGGGVVDRLRQLGFNVIDVNAGARAADPERFKNLRAEMYWKMRDWLRDRGSIPAMETLIDDLSAPTYKYDVSNRLQLESKEDMKARGIPSSDVSDALALTFSQSVMIRDAWGMKLSPKRQYADDYDEFNY